MNVTNESNSQALMAQVKMEPNANSDTRIQLLGNWTTASLLDTPIEKLLGALKQTQSTKIVISASEVNNWDSRLPVYILKIIDYGNHQNLKVETLDLPEGVQSLLQLANAVPERSGARRVATKTPFVKEVGKTVLNGLKDAQNLVDFIGEALLAFWAGFRHKARYRSVDLWLCMQEAGVVALPIVTLISLLVGLILAFVGAIQLAMFGAQIYIADLVGLGTVREMGALMTAVIISGRTGAAYAAQLGTMNVNSEIDALRTMGIEPMEFLVLPRMLALVVMMPMLGLYANLMGIIGGALVTVNLFDVSLLQYYNETKHAVHLIDLAVGLFKCTTFALLIATAGCMRGLQCGRSASAVGDAATAAVVNSIVYIVIADSLITLICNRLDI